MEMFDGPIFRFLLFAGRTGWYINHEEQLGEGHVSLDDCISSAQKKALPYSFVVDRYNPKHIHFLNDENNYEPYKDLSELKIDTFHVRIYNDVQKGGMTF